MDDICTYHIRLSGQVNVDDINPTSPLQLKVECTDQTTTLITIHTDQSGLIGLIRHLHGLGFMLLSIGREK